jgi:hypothetical protein
LWSLFAAAGQSQEAPRPEGDFPPLEKVTAGYEKVVSSLEAQAPFYGLWRRNKDQQLLAELPKDFAKQRHYIALTVASGDSYAGLQAGEAYVYWRQYDKKLALVEPALAIRSTGDEESKASVKRLFTDRVILEVPILTFVPKGGPVIDLDALLVEHADKFFGGQAKGLKKDLIMVKTAKAFPENVEIGLEVPAADGQLRTWHYSISLIPESKEYKPRLADERVGYFTTTYSDYGKFREDEVTVRYINRWHLQKADPKLKLSPPKEPIVFYIEHTTPIRYRRWVREGILMWNEAFEKVGLIGAIEVRQQDASTKEHMEKDPEDVRYNFVRWLNNGIGTAIGPSRVDPNTGQILDADIILTDGWIRHFWTQYNEVLTGVAMEGFSPETLAWLHQNPSWDPRVRLAPPAQRESLFRERLASPVPDLGGHPLAGAESRLLGEHEFAGLAHRTSQKNGLCMAANCKSHGIALLEMSRLAAAAPAPAKPDAPKEGESEESADGEQLIDGIPESFVGPLLADLVAHEVGHTLGLRHNFKASSIYTVEEINSPKVKGQKPFGGSVMDYIPVNINVETGEVQGDYGMIRVGPYDLWAIEYGYTIQEDLKPVLARAGKEPELVYGTDEDTWGPDPLARRYDFGKNPLAYAENQMRLARKNRAVLLEKFVRDGESWSRARRGYELTLHAHVSAVTMMANWVGGTFVHRDRKGSAQGRSPLEPVPAAEQRAALAFVVGNTFDEKAFDLSPELLRHLTVDKWWDNHTRQTTLMENPAWPVHDRILGIQASVLTSLMKPETLERIFDNESRLAPGEDALTIPELLQTLRGAIWGDLQAQSRRADGTPFTERDPMLSSLRRNVQKEYVERLIDLTRPRSGLRVAEKPIQDLAASQLRELASDIHKVTGLPGLDAYSRAHLAETAIRIEKALAASFVVDLGA